MRLRNDGIGLVLFHFLLDFCLIPTLRTLQMSAGVVKLTCFEAPGGSSFGGSGVSIGFFSLISKLKSQTGTWNASTIRGIWDQSKDAFATGSGHVWPCWNGRNRCLFVNTMFWFTV